MNKPIYKTIDKPVKYPTPISLNCPQRLIINEIMDKWSGYILKMLIHGPLRFNEIKRGLDGVTQKALTQSLRRLERNGLIARRVITSSPIAVEYRLTEMGQSLYVPFTALYEWATINLDKIQKSQNLYDKNND